MCNDEAVVGESLYVAFLVAFVPVFKYAVSNFTLTTPSTLRDAIITP